MEKPEATTARAIAFAEGTFVRVLASPHQDSEHLRRAFADASAMLLRNLQRRGEDYELLEGVRRRCDGLASSIPRSRG